MNKPTTLVLCIPGPWKDHNELVRRVATTPTPGRFMFLGGVLMEVGQGRHVRMVVAPSYDQMAEAFSIAGQGRLHPELLDEVGRHESVVYLEFDGLMHEQVEWIATTTQLLRDLGGYAVKVESSGNAHDWEGWERGLHGNLFDLYCLGVVLTGDAEFFASCGMRHFGLADCRVSSEIPMDAAADVMNRFNFYRLVEAPTLLDGHTFSVDERAQVFQLRLGADQRDADDLLFNPEGCWNLVPV